MEESRKFTGWFPLEFDLTYYRKSYPELQNLPDDVVAEHYLYYAENQGRTSCSYDRSEFLRELFRSNYQEAKILEIGPFDNPFCIGQNVKYFEVMDADHLRQRSALHDRSFHNVPKYIDYVSKDADLSIVNDKFDIVFSSHVIEHQTNLIRHLQIVEKLLNENGLYIMYVPDKRYCFDHFIDATRPSEILGAYYDKKTLHPIQKVIEHVSMTTHNDPARHWLGDHGDGEIGRKRFLDAIHEFESKPGEYIDVHGSQYTPQSFEQIIDTLNNLGLVNMSVYRLSHTVWGRLEFCAVLKKRCKPLNATNKYTRAKRQLGDIFYAGSIDSKSIQFSEEIDGALDECRPSMEEGTLLLRGWSIDKEASPSPRMVVLQCDHEFLAFEVNAVDRPDIVNCFKNEKLLMSGFVSLIGTAHLPSCKKIDVYVGYLIGDKLKVKRIGELNKETMSF